VCVCVCVGVRARMRPQSSIARLPSVEGAEWRALETKLFGRPSDGVQMEEIIEGPKPIYTADCTRGLNHFIYVPTLFKLFHFVYL